MRTALAAAGQRTDVSTVDRRQSRGGGAAPRDCRCAIDGRPIEAKTNSLRGRTGCVAAGGGDGGGAIGEQERRERLRIRAQRCHRAHTRDATERSSQDALNPTTGATTTPRRYDEIAGTSKMAADQAQTRLQAEEAPIAGHNAAAAVAPVTQHHRQRRWGRQRSSFEINSIQPQLNQL